MTFPEGPRIEKIQSREAILKKSSFQYGMKFSIENEILIPGPSLAAEEQGLGLKFSIENEIFKPIMIISSENENFVRGGWFFSCVRARMNFFDPRALWVQNSPQQNKTLVGGLLGISNLARNFQSSRSGRSCLFQSLGPPRNTSLHSFAGKSTLWTNIGQD